MQWGPSQYGRWDGGESKKRPSLYVLKGHGSLGTSWTQGGRVWRLVRSEFRDEGSVDS